MSAWVNLTVYGLADGAILARHHERARDAVGAVRPAQPVALEVHLDAGSGPRLLGLQLPQAQPLTLDQIAQSTPPGNPSPAGHTPTGPGILPSLTW